MPLRLVRAHMALEAMQPQQQKLCHMVDVFFHSFASLSVDPHRKGPPTQIPHSGTDSQKTAKNKNDDDVRCRECCN